MDWDAKMPSWDLGTVVGPSVSGALDLKLGGPTSGKPAPATAAAAALPPPSSSSSAAPAPKRPRSGQLAQQQAAACSVEGCAADLSRCREYHRRHKVCEAHSKTPVVTVAGRQQRFCQQCSRFHLLGEFDEIKRSCRKRLDGHNRRRRKPQPDPLNPGGLFANHHGVTRFASYPQLFPAPSSMADSKWPATIVKAETHAFHDQYYPSVHVNNSTAASLFHGNDRKRFPFLTPHGHDDCQPFTIITPSSESSANKRSNGNCALSLLSDNNNPTAPAPAPALLTIPTALPLQQYGNAARLPDPDDGDVSLTGMSYYASAGPGGKQTSVLATSAGPATQLQYHGGYYRVSGGDGSAVQAIPFSSW